MNQNNTVALFQPHPFPSRLTPEYIRFALLLQGADLPAHDNSEPLSLLELGTGQGQRINIHSACLPKWKCWSLGDDEQNRQAASATAKTAGLDSHIPQTDIQTLAEEKPSAKLPQFDIITIDSAWSQVSEENRQHLLAIVQTHLKPGGVVCIGYSAMPGCTPFLPLRDLMLQQMADGDTAQSRRFQALQALYFADTYADSEAGFFADVPGAKAFLESIKNTPFEQLEKDWLNPEWKPFYFAGIFDVMENIGCYFAGSLHLHTRLDMCLPEGVVSLLHEETDPVIQETIRDFGLNQPTRLDVFIKGKKHHLCAENPETKMTGMAFCLTGPLENIAAPILPSPSGDLVFDDEIYRLFLQALSDDNYCPKTLAALKNHPLLDQLDASLFLAVINILVAAGMVFPARAHVTPEAENACARLNRILCENSCQGKPQPALASPVLGSGIALSWIWQLFLLAFVDGATGPAACAKAVLEMPAIKNTGALRDKDGNPMSHTESLARLETEARLFFDTGLPWLAAMKALPGQPTSY